MDDFTVREYRREDIPAMTELWVQVFGDDLAFVEGFFSRLQNIGSALVAEADGKIVGIVNVITGMELVEPGKPSRIVGYTYALAVAPEFRGKNAGKALSEASRKLAFERGAEIHCTLPASESLYGYYRDALGYECVLRRKAAETEAYKTEMTMTLSATEYNMFRENMLSGKTFLRMSFFTADFLLHLCRSYGGGLCASESGICTCQVFGDTCVIHELICPDEESCQRTAASVANYLGCAKARYYLPSQSGEDFIVSEKGTVPSEAIWNLAFE